MSVALTVDCPVNRSIVGFVWFFLKANCTSLKIIFLCPATISIHVKSWHVAVGILSTVMIYLRYWENFSERNMHCMGFWNVPLLELPRGSVACFRLIFCFSLFFIWNETTQFLLYLSQGIDREAINFLVFEKEMEKWRAYIWQYGTIELCNYLIGTYMYRVPRRHQHGAVFILIPVLWNYFLKNNSCKRNHIKLRLGKYFNILKFCYRIILDFLAFLVFCY